MELPEFYTAQDVMKMLRIGSNATFYRMKKRGDIPQPIQISRSHALWPKAEFDTFLKEKRGGVNV